MKQWLLLILATALLVACKKDEEAEGFTFIKSDILLNPYLTIATSDNCIVSCLCKDNRAYVIKYTKEGNLVWAKNYSYGLPGPDNEINAIAEDDNHDLYMCGQIDPWAYLDDEYCNVFKITAAGDSIWSKGFALVGYPSSGRSIIKSNGGEMTIAGGERLHIFKIDASGNLTWQKIFPEMYVYDGINMLQMADGGYLFNMNNRNYLKTTSNGAIAWEINDTSYNYYAINHLISVSDGGFIACGSNRPGSNYQLFIIRYTGTGQVVWQRSYGLPQNEEAYSIVENANGSFTVAGTLSGQPFTHVNGMLCSVSSTGDSLWYRSFNNEFHMQPIKLFKEANDNNLLVGRLSDGNTNNSIFITRTDGNGNFK